MNLGDFVARAGRTAPRRGLIFRAGYGVIGTVTVFISPNIL